MERVETPSHQTRFAKTPKRLSLYLNALEGEEANWTLVRHLMHAGWDTRSDPAQRLPAGPDGHSLGWCGLIISLIQEKQKTKNLFFVLIFPKSVVSYSNYLYPGQLPVLPAHP